jgi:hypothetical protein
MYDVSTQKANFQLVMTYNFIHDVDRVVTL